MILLPTIASTLNEAPNGSVQRRQTILKRSEKTLHVRCNRIVRPELLSLSTIAEVIFDFPQMVAQESDS